MPVCDHCKPMYDKYAANPWQYLPQPKIYSGDGYGMTPDGVREAVKTENKRRIEWRRKALSDIREWCAQGKHQNKV